MLGSLIRDLTDAARGVARALGMERSDVLSPFIARDRLRAAKQIDDQMTSAARNSAQLALAMVSSHHPEAELRSITKGMAQTDEAGERLDHTAIF